MTATILIDGLPAAADDLHYLALVNYAAVTSFRVEDGGVRGLDLHLARLHASAIEMFGLAVEEERLRDLMERALSGRKDAWLRVSLFSPFIWARLPSDRVRPKVMTAVAPPPPPLADSVRLQSQTYVRDAAHLKHTATFPLIRARRLAQDAGFDDALFADEAGLISEGSLWNIGFVRGGRIVWPKAPMLSGVAQALIQRGLAEQGLSSETRPVHLGDIAAFDGAFLCNSATPVCPITAIDAAVFAIDRSILDRLARAWASQPPQAIAARDDDEAVSSLGR